jgi:CBS domain-containing protein
MRSPPQRLRKPKDSAMTTISEVMTRDVEVIGPEASLQRAAQMMDDLNVGSLPVCEGRRLVGMITDRDITVRATAAGLAPTETQVLDVMTESTRCCAADETTEAVMEQMGQSQIRRLPVVDDDGEVIGIVSLGDLATRLDGHIDQALRDISTPSEPDRSIA